MLVVPLLALTPVYLRMARTHRLKWWLAGTLAFLLLVEIATLSRSGWLGLAVGALVLVIPYRRFVLTKQLLYPLGALVVAASASSLVRQHFVSTLLGQRFSTSGSSTQSHFAIYSYIRPVLHDAPAARPRREQLRRLLPVPHGEGELRRRTRTGSRSSSSRACSASSSGSSSSATSSSGSCAARRLGRLSTGAATRKGARVRPLAWGFTAALAGTMAANFFYLTMQFYYFYAFLALALALPLVFSGRPTTIGSR